jgi:outer membrane protein OmpA-like peptidoglycan-associated protein
MIRQLPLIAILGLCGTIPAWPQSVPLYQVTVVERTVKAVNYQYRRGPTPIDFRGTVLLPQSKGDADVESKAGRTEIDAHFNNLPAPNRFGGEYLTYVLWAITPEGHPKNLGEIIPGSSDKAHTQVTTDLQVFGMIVTAEPYAAVRLPSDVVVMENEVRRDTVGAVEPVQVRYELMPRHGYTYNKTAAAAIIAEKGPTVSMSEYETLLELYQAKNAVQIAQASGAGQYAGEVLAKAQSQLDNAQTLHDRRVDKSLIISAARQASQTAEDARTLGAQRAKEAEVATARSDAERERQLRIAAEAQVAQAQQQASTARDRARRAEAQSSADRMQLEQIQQTPMPVTIQTPPVQPRIDYSTVRPPSQVPAQTPIDDQSQKQLRIALAQRLSGYFPAEDSPRGLIATVSSFAFRGNALDGSALANLGQIAAMVNAHPGLTIEVDAHCDTATAEAQRLAGARAEAVRDALVRSGVSSGSITVRDMGNTRPLGPNNTAQGREANRRTEIVIAGGPIGTMAAWDRSYSLNPKR